MQRLGAGMLARTNMGWYQAGEGGQDFTQQIIILRPARSHGEVQRKVSGDKKDGLII